MTPQELDLILKDIRRARNLLIFMGFIPMIYLLASGVSMMITSSVNLEIEMNMSVEMMLWAFATLVISAVLLFHIFRPNKYLVRQSKVGLAIYTIGIMSILVYSVMGLIEVLGHVDMQEKANSLIKIGGFAIYAGVITFVINAKVNVIQKITHILFYILPLAAFIGGYETGIGVTGVSILVYPMLSSYFAVKWAGKEFFAFMNSKNNEN